MESRQPPPMGGKELLLRKNTSLTGQVTAQRQEINGLRSRFQSLEETETKWQETTACVSSLWDELNATIAFLQFKLGGDVKADQIAAPALEEGSARALLTEANPFLAHMLQAYLPDDPVARKAAVSLAEDLTATESALRARMKDTMRAATSVLRAVDEIAASSASRPLPGPEENRLSSLVALLKAENGRLVKESLQEHVALKNLEANVADKEAEMVVLNRRLAIAEEPGSERGGKKQRTESPAEDVQVSQAAQAAQGAPRVELSLAIQEVERRDKLIASLESELYSERRERNANAQQAKLQAQDGQARLDAVTRDLERANQKLRDAYREQDRLNGKLRDTSRDIDRGSRAVRREARLEAALSKLEADVNRLRSERNAAEDKLRQLEQGVGSKTAPELLAQMKGMESEMKMLKDAVASHKSSAEAATRMTPDAADHAARMAYMQALVDGAVSKLNHWIYQYEEQVKENEELRWMIRWGVAGPGGDGGGAKAAKDIASFMKKELPALEMRLQAAHEERTAATEKIAADKLAKAEGELQGARGRLAALEADLKWALADAATLKEESDMFWKEMDSVSEAYGASREQNTRLLEAMAKRDEDNARLMSEAAAAARERAIADDNRENSNAKLREAEKEVSEWKRRAEDVEGMLDEAAKERDGLRLEATQRKEHEQELAREIKALEISVSAMKEEVAGLQRHVEAVEADKKKHLTDLKLERTRADRANAILSGRKDLKHLATDDKEMAALRKMVNCSVCSTRLKDRMITRCNHLFCSECIQENLASRHRKCPGCGGKFSENDVQPFFFT